MSGRKRPNKRIVLWFLAALAAVFTGCGSRDDGERAQKQETQQAEIFSMETEPVLDYEVPVVLPGILVDRIGYEALSHKTAVVRGSSLPARFRIVNADTGEVVYTGSLEGAGYDTETKEYNSYGDFSALTEEGVYYMECDMLGRSYSFEIKDTMYEDLMEEAIALLNGRRSHLTEADVLDVCQSVSVLLLSYELFAPVYEGRAVEGKEPPLIALVKSYAEWLLTMQDAQTGAVLEEGEALWTETAWLSAVLAKFSYTYQKYDSVYATVCLQASDKAWKAITEQKQQKAEESGEGSYEEVMFYAAAELYRATGRNAYHLMVIELSKDMTADADKVALVFGTLTYASTKRSVNMDLCARLTKVLLDEAEYIAELAQEDVFSTGSSLAEESLEEILWDMVVVSSVDYIITNHEYATLIENHLHYLAGVNETAACHTCPDGESAGADIGKDCMSTAEYVMMLSEILSHKQEE